MIGKSGASAGSNNKMTEKGVKQAQEIRRKMIGKSWTSAEVRGKWPEKS